MPISSFALPQYYCTVHEVLGPNGFSFPLLFLLATWGCGESVLPRAVASSTSYSLWLTLHDDCYSEPAHFACVGVALPE